MSTFRFNEQKITSLRHRIADDIRKAILERKLKPGDRLIELEMSKQMGVSRGPIREAFRVLELEGLIHSSPFRETVVADFSKEEITEVLLPIRLTVETYALRKALPLFEERDFQYLAACVDSMRTYGKDNDVMKLVESDLDFHEYMITKSQVTNLMTIWTSIFYRIRLHFIMQDQYYEDLSTVWQQHHSLLEAIRSRDIEYACSELKFHIYDANIVSLNVHNLK